jgi:hypothetical protein
VTAALFALQAALLIATGVQIKLGESRQHVYILEGDLVSDDPHKDAEAARLTTKARWMRCRYWTGFQVRTLFLPETCGPLFAGRSPR